MLREYWYGRSDPTPFEDYIWSRIDSSGGPDACWPYRTSSPGYPKVKRRGPYREMLVSRVVLSMTTGKEPDGRNALHSCDNPRCVNPRHLRWGTQKDNLRDAASRGRLWTQVAKGSPEMKARMDRVRALNTREMQSAGQLRRWERYRAEGKARR